jgi:hypothetical protein
MIMKKARRPVPPAGFASVPPRFTTDRGDENGD